MYLGAPLMHRGMHPLSRQRQQPVAQSRGLLLIGEPDTVERKVLEIGIAPQVHVTLLTLSKQLAGSYEVPRLPFSGPHRRKPRRRGAGGGASTGGSPRRARPGHRTERRNQYDTRQRKIVRAQLPWIVNAEIELWCCASTTVRKRF